MKLLRPLRDGRLYPLLIGTALFLPGVLISIVLWNSFAGRLELSQEKQLRTNLQIFELMIDHELNEFRNALARLAADNTLQITVDLDIRPQLRRYLESHLQVSNFTYLIVADRDGRQLLQLGEVPTAGVDCGSDAAGTVERGFLADGHLYLRRVAPLHNKKRRLGYLCGGFAVSGKPFIASLSEKLEGTPTLAWRGMPTSAGFDPMLPDPSVPAGIVYQPRAEGGLLKGMYTNFPLGGENATLGVLLDASKQKDIDLPERLTIGFVLIALLSATGYGLRMLGLRRRAETALQQERERAVVTLNSIADAVVRTDTGGRIVYLNPAAEELAAVKLADAAGFDCYRVIDIRCERSGQKIPYMSNEPGPGGLNDTITDAVLVAGNGSRTAVHFSVAQVRGSGSAAGRVIVLRNMGREQELKRRLAWKASRDDLTGLLNRGEFRRAAASAIQEAQSGSALQALLYIDLDEFKIVNDTCGHQAGDRLLKQVGTLLLSQTRKVDTVARLGGDEFGLLLADCSTNEAVATANSLIDSINDIRFSFMNKVFHVGASVGLVCINSDTCDLEDLLATVDAACYTAKEQGRNRVFVGAVDAKKISLRMEELNQASRIRKALRDDRLVLFYQSIVATENPDAERHRHLEILVRMLDENGELVSPGGFIPVAERNGLMQGVDRWIIRHLFQSQGENLRRRHGANERSSERESEFVYTINLSGASLVDPTFLEYVKSQLREFSIPPAMIGFEITETQVITHLDKAILFISELKALGCAFLLDDFGSGMSSFGYLKSLPVDYLKIDGQFVKDMCTDPIDCSMVKAINEIGHVMGLKTIAEYVENREILSALQEIGVDMAQGYGIAPPARLSPSGQPLYQEEVGVSGPDHCAAAGGS